MNKLLYFSLLFTGTAFGQSFAPAPGEPGTTAIPKDSACFVAWANGGTVVRGYIDIQDTTAVYSGSNRATFGQIEYAFGPAQGNVNDIVSLGDSGIVTLTFPQFILDGPGFDFAIFENGFMDHYMELAHVEVSSDGVHFFRFPSTSEIPLDDQLGNGSLSDCGYVNNLAGKYRAGYGTPFDLADVPDDPNLNKGAITHVRLIDAIGAIAGTGTTDQYGTRINDPYPTAFASGGFDLDAVGIINGTVGLNEMAFDGKVYPNPTSGVVYIALANLSDVALVDITGKVVWSEKQVQEAIVDLKGMGIAAGAYRLIVTGGSGVSGVKVVVL
jgi:hypothetical protein